MEDTRKSFTQINQLAQTEQNRTSRHYSFNPISRYIASEEFFVWATFSHSMKALNLSTSLHLKRIEPRLTEAEEETHFTKEWPQFSYGRGRITVNILEDRVMLAYIPFLKAIHVFDLLRLDDEKRIIDMSCFSVERTLAHHRRPIASHALLAKGHYEFDEFTFFDNSRLFCLVK